MVGRRLTHGSLFAGIGGFDLGFERAGIKTVWQVEIDEYCRRVLEKHFPGVMRFADIRTCAGFEYSDGAFPNVLPWVDIISGGFPCQDISAAGKRVGIDGERSGLWTHMWRVVCEVRPRFVVVENVSALLHRGIERVLGDLAEIGYDAEWDCIPASAIGAPHRRDRVWILAYPDSLRFDGTEPANATAHYQESNSAPYRKEWRAVGSEIESSCEDVADSDSGRCESGRKRTEKRSLSEPNGNGEAGEIRQSDYWIIEPNVGRVAHGIPARVDRLRGLGNSVVPQIAQFIAERILEAEGLKT
jgi:DNA (cytosine-5)-methyltransferase 1